MKNAISVKIPTLDAMNDAFSAIHLRMRELTELYYKCKNHKPYYPAECNDILRKIDNLKQVLSAFEDYDFVPVDEEEED